METRVWRVPPGFVSLPDYSDKNGIRRPVHGFKSKNSPFAAQLDASEFLLAEGIPFPPGSEALYDQSSQCLIVRNTQENLNLVNEMATGVDVATGPENVAIEISALECEMPTAGSETPGNWPAYHSIEALPEKRVKVLDRVSRVTRSGQRISISHVSISASPKNPDGKSPTEPEHPASEQTGFHDGESGTKAEVETVVGPDNNTLSTNINYRFRRPDAGSSTSEIRFETSFASWDDYPVVLHVSPVQNQEGKFLVVVGNIRLVNPGGWNVKALRDEAAKAATDKK